MLSTLRSALALAALALFASAPAAQTRPVEPDGFNFIVSPALVVETNGTASPDDDVLHPTGTREALAEAFLLARPGDRILLSGRVPRLALAVGSPHSRYSAHRAQPFDEITVVGDGTAVLELVQYGGIGGGVGSITWENLVWESYGQVGQIFFVGTHGSGTITCRDIEVRSSASSGSKWWTRAEGSAGWKFVRVRSLGGGQEWLIYVDNAQGLELYQVTAHRWARGLLQSVLRDAATNGSVHPRPTSGDLIARACTAIDTGENGAGAFTVNGWTGGVVELAGLEVRSRFDTSAIVANFDKHQLELAVRGQIKSPAVGLGYLNGNGYAIDHLRIIELTAILPNTRRNVCALDGIERLDVYGGLRRRSAVVSTKPAFAFEYRGAGKGPNGFGTQAIGELRLLGRKRPGAVRDLAEDWNLQTPRPFTRSGAVIDPMPYYSNDRTGGR